MFGLSNKFHSLYTGERAFAALDYNSFIEQKRTYIFEGDQIDEILQEKATERKKKFKLLDCASGEGYGTNYLVNRFADKLEKGIGCDIDEETVRLSRSKYHNIDFVQGDILMLDKIFLDKFDFFVCNQTIEHFDEYDQKKVLGLAFKLLNQEGYFFAAVPNKPVYQRYSAQNVFHKNEQDFRSFKELIETQPFSEIQYFGQTLPNYQRKSRLRGSKVLHRILGILPKNVLRVLVNNINPKIELENLTIEPYNQNKDGLYKTLIAVCRK